MSFFSKLFKSNQSSEQKADKSNEPHRSKAQQYKFEALGAMRIGNMRYAIPALEESLRLDPQFETRYYLAHCQRRAGNNEQALELYDQLLQEIPDHILSLIERASLRLEMDMVEPALTDADRAKEVSDSEQDDVAAIDLLRAKALLALGEYAEALSAIDASLLLDDASSHSWLVKVRALCKMERLDEACDIIAAARKLFPEEERLLLYLSEIEYRRGHSEAATQLLREVLELDPFNEEAHMQLAKEMQERGELEQAILFLSELAEDSSPSPRLQQMRVELFRQAGREEDAERLQEILAESCDTAQTARFDNLYEGGLF